jgi:putative heme-binding domain-containing protein
VRRAALQLLRRDAELVAAIRASRLLADPDLRVRVAALLALADAPPSREPGAEILATLQAPENARDRWVSDAATIAAARHDAGFLAAVVASARPADGAPAAPAELLPNPAFEQSDGTGLAGWQPRHYAGQAQSSVDAPGRGGGHALELRSERGADSSFFASVAVEPDTTYRLSGWIRTEAVVARGGRGAQLNVHEIQGARNARTDALTGTRDWTQVAVTFDSGAHRRLTINCLLGGWGLASGRAWFDDLSLVRVDRALPGRLGRIVARVTAHYAARAPADPIGDLLAGLDLADARVASELLDTLAEHWPAHRPPQLDTSARAKLARFATTLRGPAQAGLLALAMRWGDPDLVQPARAAVLADLRSVLISDALPFDERVAAAARLRRLADGEDAIDAILAVLQPGTDPAFAARLLDVVATSRDPATGGRILARLDQLAPATRRAALGILLRREPWCAALLDRLERGAGGAELPAELRLQLETHPVAAIAARAQALRAAAGDRAEVLRRITAELPAGGDVARGRALYAANCAACHRLGGTGGLLGPALDRIGERPRDELLIAILDPNRSIEDNYRLWTVAMRDGRSFAGRVVGETRRAIRLLDLSGIEHELPRGELESLQQTPMSLMPATFEHLRADGLADLLAFLAAQR